MRGRTWSQRQLPTFSLSTPVLTSEATQFADGLDATTFINLDSSVRVARCAAPGTVDAECDPTRARQHDHGGDDD